MLEQVAAFSPLGYPSSQVTLLLLPASIDGGRIRKERHSPIRFLLLRLLFFLHLRTNDIVGKPGNYLSHVQYIGDECRLTWSIRVSAAGKKVKE